MDLPTYTNIWRIEKRLYKLYDFRLPQPLSVVTLGVFLGVLAIWAILLRLVHFPLETPWHVVWIVPPFVITFLATRPVIEGKRLTELLLSQLRYFTEARVYTRMAPEHEPAEVRVTVRVWHRDPLAGPLPVVAPRRSRRRVPKAAVEAAPERAALHDGGKAAGAKGARKAAQRGRGPSRAAGLAPGARRADAAAPPLPAERTTPASGLPAADGPPPLPVRPREPQPAGGTGEHPSATAQPDLQPEELPDDAAANAADGAAEAAEPGHRTGGRRVRAFPAARADEREEREDEDVAVFVAPHQDGRARAPEEEHEEERREEEEHGRQSAEPQQETGVAAQVASVPWPAPDSAGEREPRHRAQTREGRPEEERARQEPEPAHRTAPEQVEQKDVPSLRRAPADPPEPEPLPADAAPEEPVSLRSEADVSGGAHDTAERPARKRRGVGRAVLNYFGFALPQEDEAAGESAESASSGPHRTLAAERAEAAERRKRELARRRREGDPDAFEFAEQRRANEEWLLRYRENAARGDEAEEESAAEAAPVTARADVRARRRAEEMMAAPEQEAAEAGEARQDAEPAATAEAGSDWDPGQVHAEQAAEHAAAPAAQSRREQARATGLPATPEEAAAQEHRSERPRPHAAPWDLPAPDADAEGTEDQAAAHDSGEAAPAERPSSSTPQPRPWFETAAQPSMRAAARNTPSTADAAAATERPAEEPPKPASAPPKAATHSTPAAGAGSAEDAAPPVDQRDGSGDGHGSRSAPAKPATELDHGTDEHDSLRGPDGAGAGPGERGAAAAAAPHEPDPGAEQSRAVQQGQPAKPAIQLDHGTDEHDSLRGTGTGTAAEPQHTPAERAAAAPENARQEGAPAAGGPDAQRAKPAMQLDHGTGEHESYAETAAAEEPAPAEAPPTAAAGPEPAAGKPQTQLDHGTGEHESYAETAAAGGPAPAPAPGQADTRARESAEGAGSAAPAAANPAPSAPGSADHTEASGDTAVTPAANSSAGSAAPVGQPAAAAQAAASAEAPANGSAGAASQDSGRAGAGRALAADSNGPAVPEAQRAGSAEAPSAERTTDRAGSRTAADASGPAAESPAGSSAPASPAAVDPAPEAPTAEAGPGAAAAPAQDPAAGEGAAAEQAAPSRAPEGRPTDARPASSTPGGGSEESAQPAGASAEMLLLPDNGSAAYRAAAAASEAEAEDHEPSAESGDAEQGAGSATALSFRDRLAAARASTDDTRTGSPDASAEPAADPRIGAPATDAAKPAWQVDHGTGEHGSYTDAANGGVGGAADAAPSGPAEAAPAAGSAAPAAPAAPGPDAAQPASSSDAGPAAAESATAAPAAKPAWQMDHGTGEHGSYTDAAGDTGRAGPRPVPGHRPGTARPSSSRAAFTEDPEIYDEAASAAPPDDDAHRRTDEELSAAEESALRARAARRARARGAGLHTDPERSARLGRSMRSVPTGGQPSAAEPAPEHDDRPAAAEHAPDQSAAEARSVAAAPVAEPGTPSNGAAPSAEPEADDRAPDAGAAVFSRVAENARRLSNLFDSPPSGPGGRSGNGGSATGAPERHGRRASAADADLADDAKPELQLDHGTGEQNSLPGAPGRPAVEAPDRPADTPSGATRGWRRLARVVSGGSAAPKAEVQGGDLERLRTPLGAPRRIVVLGCTGGAGQTVTALMLGHTLAVHRDQRIVAVDVNPGAAGMSRRIKSRTPETLTSLLANADAVDGYPAMSRYTTATATGLEVVATLDDPYVQTLDDRDYAGLAALLSSYYEVALLDPAATGVARALPTADGLVLVAPASADAARSVAMTFEWLDGHGYSGLRQRSVVVVNGVSRRSLTDVDEAEQVARGRCRAIVRVPWDDHITSGRLGDVSALRSTTRRAHAALGGVLMNGIAEQDPVRPGPQPGSGASGSNGGARAARSDEVQGRNGARGSRRPGSTGSTGNSGSTGSTGSEEARR